MGHTRISVTIPEDTYHEAKKLVSQKKIKLSNLVADAISEKIIKIKEEEYIKEINRQLDDPEITDEYYRVAETIATHTEIDKIPW